ncbi:XRE family transcriptional regulator [Yersinia ruckeri]|uniref:XRE family transcriptional regulator n=2 Tax=Yersinia ruckeri TaxID=29486 RepID=UPI000BDE601A|nr:S24 family peptidase [Yersinia ruckeri]MCK8572478.1 helix-turn-helix domain-containing protein [Yersinia ruckeri]MCW6539665.1 helix-turn-helix domain-containing protein [Yersinia ruckeri]MCW6555121.1 helix-turn-helix domain-containing protein [Yersinia ruckeri]MCW6638569.1 helix-turn-helix domain-containing protein [Yersinia ruckeri]UZX60818.1 helix-turn-helix domain-containing protein [Yersinia ruckeri]
MTNHSSGCNLLLMVENEIKYDDFAARLNSLLREKEVSVSNLAKVSGVSYEMARRYTLGTAKPRDEKMLRIASHLSVSPAYLDYGVTTAGTVEPDKKVVKIRQLEVFASAGNGYINNEFPTLISSIEFPVEKVYELFGRKSLDGIELMNVDGDSMMPTLCPKDLLFIDTRIDHFNGDGVYVFNFEDSTFVKRLQKVKGRKLAVLSDNEKYPPFFIEANEMSDLYVFGKLIKHLPLKFNDFA